MVKGRYREHAGDYKIVSFSEYTRKVYCSSVLLFQSNFISGNGH